jgi:DNA-binding LacI/PurR family transcriptional regulator
LPNVDAIGFDDSPAAMLISPPLASVRQPVAEIARQVVGLLLAQLHGAGLPDEGVMLRPELVSRGLRGPDPGP